MASDKTLNARNLVALGADRLAELLLELATGNAPAKRRLRLELASRHGGDAVATEIRKRLATIGKARSFVDWNKVRDLARDIDTQREAIVRHVAPGQPTEAFELLWRLLTLAPSLYLRCDDSNGQVGAVIDAARDDLAAIAPRAKIDPSALVEQVFTAVETNDHGQFDGIISLMAESLGAEGLAQLKARFEDSAAHPPTPPPTAARKLIGIGSDGPVYEDEWQARSRAIRIRSALTDIADALGDADGYAARFTADERTNPATAADIAERLLHSGRPDDAMAALQMAEAKARHGRHWPDWFRVRIVVLDALGRSEDAQAERWGRFQAELSVGDLRAYLKRLPDFDDVEAERRAMAFIRNHADFHGALQFLLDWPDHRQAAELVLSRPTDLDGDQYWVLTPAADAVATRAPLAATLVLRAMIDVTLDRAKARRYGHAARHLQTCASLAKRIEDYGSHPDHESYAAALKARHGRKTAFWNV